MKNSLHALALIFAASLPCTIAAGFVGLAVPAVFGAGYLVLGLSATLLLQLLFDDYAFAAQSLVVSGKSLNAITPWPTTEKSEHRLAA